MQTRPYVQVGLQSAAKKTKESKVVSKDKLQERLAKKREMMQCVPPPSAMISTYPPYIALYNSTAHRAQSGLTRRDRESRTFGYFFNIFHAYARIISELDFHTIHLKIITPKKALFRSNDLISY